MRKTSLVIGAILVFIGAITVNAAPYFTPQRSIIPYDNTENVGTSTNPWDEGWFNELCLSADCRSTWASVGAPFPFTPTTNYSAATNATTSPVWFQNGFQASSTSYLVYASTTALSASGQIFVTGGNAVTAPNIALTSAGTTGLYLNGSSAALTTGGVGVTWGSLSGVLSWYPNTDNLRNLGGVNNRWLNYWGTGTATTSALYLTGLTSTPLLATNSLGQVIAATIPISLANGGTATTTFSPGGVVFSDSTMLTQDTTNFFWDDTNNRLGIGTTAPGYTLGVVGSASFGGTVSNRRKLDIDANGLTTFYASNNALVDYFTMQNGSINAAGQGLCQQYNMSSSTSAIAGIYFAGAQICGVSEGDYTTAASALAGLSFYTSSVPGTVLERSRIDNEGDFGIGSTTPYAKLTVQNATANPTAIFEDQAADATPVMIDTSGNLFVGTTTGNSGSKMIVWGSGGRYQDINTNGRNRFVSNDNNLAPVISLINSWEGGGASLQLQLGYGGTSNIEGTVTAGARLAAVPEATFTSDTATQDAYLQLAAVVDGAISIAADVKGGSVDGTREQMVLVSPRAAIVNGNIVSTLGFATNDTNFTSPGTTTAAIKAIATGTHTAATQPTDLAFFTTEAGGTATSTEKMRLTGRGFLGIGTTSPQYQLSVASTTDGNIFQLYDSDGNCLQNPEAGAITTTCTSDEKLKENIKDSEGSAIDFLKGFRIRDYDVKASGDTMTGVIAQEVRETHPELVKDIAPLVEKEVIKDGEKTTILVPGETTEFVEIPSTWQLIKAIQELDARVTALERGKKTAEGQRDGMGTLLVLGAVGAWAVSRKRD